MTSKELIESIAEAATRLAEYTNEDIADAGIGTDLKEIDQQLWAMIDFIHESQS